MDFLKISGKSAIVTGGGRGIGRCIAQSLASYGVNVMICDVVEERCINVVKEIKESGGNVIYCVCDVTNLAQVKQVVSMTVEHFGGIDILVNNAGIGSRLVPFWETTYEQWDRMIDVNLTGAYRFSFEVFPYMKAKNYGKIVNISSGAGVTGLAGNLSYSASKAGMIGMTKAMAKEVAQFKINVNAIAVGTTITPLAKETGFIDSVPSDIPWGRLGTPEDVANVVLFLVSDSSEYISGQVICPNGARRT